MKLFEESFLNWEADANKTCYVYHGKPKFTYFIEHQQLYIETFFDADNGIPPLDQQILIDPCTPQQAINSVMAIENITACTQCVGTGKQTYWYAANSWDHFDDDDCLVCNGKGYIPDQL